MASPNQLLVYDMPPRSAVGKDYWQDYLRNKHGEDVDTVTILHDHYADRIQGDLSISITDDIANERLIQLINSHRRSTMVSFNTPSLPIDPSNATQIFPEPTISRRFNSKVNQYELFKDIGLSVPEFSVTTVGDLSTFTPPYFYTLDLSSGGNGNGLVYDQDDILHIQSKYPHDSVIIVAEEVHGITSKPCTAVICGDESWTMLPTADQVTVGNAYAGNVYPSVHEGTEAQDKMSNMTDLLAKHLTTAGYRGMFGADFLVTESGDVWLTDLNARRVGAYGLYLSLLGVSLVDCEHAAATQTGKKLPERLELVNQPDDVVGHSHIGIVSLMKQGEQPTTVASTLAKSPETTNGHDNFRLHSLEIFYPEGTELASKPATIGRTVLGADNFSAAMDAFNTANVLAHSNMLYAKQNF